MSTTVPRISLLSHPYRQLIPVAGGRDALRAAAREPGSALIWSVGSALGANANTLVEGRPGGLALIVILPPVQDLDASPDLIHFVHRARPHGILPHHLSPSPGDLAQVLRRPPIDLAAEVTDYLSWRGLGVDRETTHLVRRILELSSELRTITALSRSMYLSRRALGRRLMTRGLPVPSHWLQLGRLLRLAIRLQNSDESVFSIAYDSGYPDGFSVSNQMQRLVGFRPSQVRQYLGWEWLVEQWLRREAEDGGLGWVVEKLEGYAAKYGRRLEPAGLLREMAEKGERFHEKA
jgi:AraC-like DNA-binding protein